MNNDRVFFIVVLPFFLILLNIVYFILIFLHELFHAIPALIFSKEDVKIYIGYKRLDIDNAKLTIHIGRFSIAIKPKFSYLKTGGYCAHGSVGITMEQELIIVLAGPILAALFSILLCFTAFLTDAHGALKLVSIFLCVVSIPSLFHNLYPRTKPIEGQNGEMYYPDGYQMLRLVKLKVNLKSYERASTFYNNEDYHEAAILLTQLVDRDFLAPIIYRLLITSLVKTRDFEKALLIDNQFREQYTPEINSDDLCNSGLIKSELNLFEESLINYNESIQMNAENMYSLNNRGYTYNLLARYDDAIKDFDKALVLDPGFAYSYCNRGLAKIKTGDVENGLNDINHSIILDENNSYTYLNLGIYHTGLNDHETALRYFEKAKNLDAYTHNIDVRINEAKRNIGA